MHFDAICRLEKLNPGTSGGARFLPSRGALALIYILSY